jgi:hypothetical protein
MADFYFVLASAVSKLPIGAPQARQELYNHARTFLITQLHEKEPRVLGWEVIREQIALEAAIRKLEAQLLADQYRPLKELTSHQLTANHAAGPDVNMKPQPSMARDRRADTFQDRIEPRAGIKPKAQTAAAYELFANRQATADEDFPELISGILEQSKRGVASGGGIKISTANRHKNGTPVPMVEPHRNASIRSGRSTINDRNARKALAPEEVDNRNTKTAFLDPAIIGLAAIAVMLAFIAVISIPVVTIYLPRLLWFFEHLIDYPSILFMIPIILGLCIMVSLPIFGERRKKSAVGFLWLHFIRSYNVDFRNGI